MYKLRPLRPLLLIFATALLVAAITACGSTKNAQKPVVEQRQPQPPRKPHVKPPKAAPGKVAEALVAEARNWIGTPYAWGGHTYDGVDCSGFLMCLYDDVAGIKLPRTTRQQIEYCVAVDDSDRAVGDILFFSSGKSGGKVAHVGIYIGDNKMIHASSSRGVIEESLDLNYYRTHYLGVGRVPLLAEATPPPAKPEPAPEPKSQPIAEPIAKPVEAPETPAVAVAEPQKPTPTAKVKNAFARAKAPNRNPQGSDTAQ